MGKDGPVEMVAISSKHRGMVGSRWDPNGTVLSRNGMVGKVRMDKATRNTFEGNGRRKLWSPVVHHQIRRRLLDIGRQGRASAGHSSHVRVHMPVRNIADVWVRGLGLIPRGDGQRLHGMDWSTVHIGRGTRQSCKLGSRHGVTGSPIGRRS